MPLVGERRALGRGLSAVLADAPEDPALAELARRLAAVEDELARYREREGYMTAEQMYLAAAGFVERNPRLWARLVARARAAAEAGVRFSTKRELEDMRAEAAASGAKWRVLNSAQPVLSRMLVAAVPEVGPYLKRNRSKVDRYFDGTEEPPARKAVDDG